MNTVPDSPEHHFLTYLEKLKENPRGWVGLHFALSRKLSHSKLISKPENIIDKLAVAQNESKDFYSELKRHAENIKPALVYKFTDTDVLMLARLSQAEDEKKVLAVFREMSAKLPEKFSEYLSLSQDFYLCQKLADHKFLTAERMNAYRSMCDNSKVQSISVRRKRRSDPMVLIVEDDRFTASYAANILNKEYDLIHAKSGEEGIIDYIDNAPDMVFMDVHLPGLSGHETTQAIKKIDPDAFIIMLSVDTEKTNVVSASANGANGFLKKPFSKDRLLAMVQKSPFIRRIHSSGSDTHTTFY